MNARILLFLVVILLPVSHIFAQVKIGGAPGVPVSSAVLELDGGGNKALRLPIIQSKEQLGDIANPVNGLVAYGSHTGGLIYYHNGAWFELNSSELGFKLPHTGIYENAGNAVLKVTNNGNNGNGLEGISSNAAGVFGMSGVGTGVKGVTADGFGMEATSIAGVAFKASSQSGTSARFSHASNTGRSLVVENGRVGIGTLNPATGLHINLTDFAITGIANANVVSGGLPVEGVGKKMVFSGTSGALRAGVASATSFGDANVGYASVGLGAGNIASNHAAFASGWETKATGLYSTAMGNLSEARGAGGFAAGNELISYSLGEIVLGTCNTTYVPLVNGDVNFYGSDRLFVLGNGTASNARSNAMVVLKNGNVGIGNNTPAHKLVVNGDFNLTGSLRANGNAGTNGQVLTSTGTGTAWASVGLPKVGYRGGLDDNLTPIITNTNNKFIRFGKSTGFGNFDEGGGTYNKTLTNFGYIVPSEGVYHIEALVSILVPSIATGYVYITILIDDGSLPFKVIAYERQYVDFPDALVTALHASVTVKLPANANVKVKIDNVANSDIIVTDDATSPSFLSVFKVY